MSKSHLTPSEKLATRRSVEIRTTQDGDFRCDNKFNLLSVQHATHRIAAFSALLPLHSTATLYASRFHLSFTSLRCKHEERWKILPVSCFSLSFHFKMKIWKCAQQIVFFFLAHKPVPHRSKSASGSVEREKKDFFCWFRSFAAFTLHRRFLTSLSSIQLNSYLSLSLSSITKQRWTFHSHFTSALSEFNSCRRRR